MKLVIGLGNPGKKYALTRHNLGFLVLDALALQLNEKWTEDKEANAAVIETNHKGEKLVLAKPMTFMNDSGRAVASLLAQFKLNAEDLWLVHDDVDLPFGVLRIRQEGSAGGHNGVQSVIEAVGTEAFVRFRIGIDSAPERMTLEDWVISKFSKSEQNALEGVATRAATKILIATKEGVEVVTENLSE